MPLPRGERRELLDLSLPARFAGHDICPQRPYIVRGQHVLPRRHIALPIGDGIDKARLAIPGKGSQVDAPLRVTHSDPMTGHAVLREQVLASLDLFGREFCIVGFRPRAKQCQSEKGGKGASQTRGL
jgi:hypothetical protein